MESANIWELFSSSANNKHARKASFSSGVRLPVIARHNAARISLENSGVIGSLGELKNTLLTVTSCIKQLLLCSFLFLVVGVDGVVGGEVEAAALLALEGEAGDEITHVDHVAEFADVL